MRSPQRARRIIVIPAPDVQNILGHGSWRLGKRRLIVRVAWRLELQLAPTASGWLSSRFGRDRPWVIPDTTPDFNNTFIQVVGIGSCMDGRSAIRRLVFDEAAIGLPDLVDALAHDFLGQEPLRRRLVHKTPKCGNDDFCDLAPELQEETISRTEHV